MLLAFDSGLIETKQTDVEMINFARSHYSRKNKKSKSLFGPSRTLTLRNAEGTILFGWTWPKDGMRRDGQNGYCCAIFRNESERQSSEIILEAEGMAEAKWGKNRMFTYIDASKVKSSNPGYCFKMAGWKFAGISKSGKHLLVKYDQQEVYEFGQKGIPSP